MTKIIVESCYRFCDSCRSGTEGEIVENPDTAIMHGRPRFQFRCKKCTNSFSPVREFGRFPERMARTYYYFQDFGVATEKREDLWWFLAQIGWVHQKADKTRSVRGFIPLSEMHKIMDDLIELGAYPRVNCWYYRISPNQVTQWICSTDNDLLTRTVQKLFIGELAMHVERVASTVSVG